MVADFKGLFNWNDARLQVLATVQAAKVNCQAGPNPPSASVNCCKTAMRHRGRPANPQQTHMQRHRPATLQAACGTECPGKKHRCMHRAGYARNTSGQTLCGSHAQRVSAKRSEGAKTAGQHNDLLMLASAAERIKHQLDAVVVAIDQGVIKDNGHDRALFCQHRAHCETHENGDLLLSTVGQAVEQLRPIALYARHFKSFAELKFGTGKKVI